MLAGLERLLYLTPFELAQLVRALRMAETSSVMRQLGDAGQDFLDRFEVGQEILGAEPLAFLIAQHVLRETANPCETFAQLTGDETALLAVATNLTQGFLEILPGLDTPLSRAEGQAAGRPDPNPAEHTVLLQSLLASSAFPAVFKPRWSWEVFPRSSEVCQYVDGGVMDNLPLDAVVHYLDHKVKKGIITARPVSSTGQPLPHLLFAASLEPKLRRPRDPAVIARNWPALLTRAGQLRYNRKIDGFRTAQQRFRTIWEKITPKPGADAWRPLDIEVVTVKPEWLCGTFAFHPMLGFRRRKQAQNIAHGCAMTLGTLYTVERGHPEWFAAWGFKSLIGDPENAFRTEAISEDPGMKPGETDIRLHPQSQGRPKKGECWFRSGAECPFAKPKLPPDLTTIPKDLHRIYELCGEEKTHRPAAGLGRLYQVD
ncbi:MAG TPA: patatin-like phospholipase family protein [Thermoanaerobaculia bacterium]|nr:patatin-like phospholipase family protein [Thermoanaerobaculia bacterium]